MREIRLYGSEGGGALTGSPYPYLPELETCPHNLSWKRAPTRARATPFLLNTAAPLSNHRKQPLQQSNPPVLCGRRLLVR